VKNATWKQWYKKNFPFFRRSFILKRLKKIL
jgi:hypothetical protein